MANIDTDLILASLKRGEDYVIPAITKKHLAYLRCWANRKGYFVSLIGTDATVSKENRKRMRTELMEWLAKGCDFFTEVDKKQIQYLRNLVSEYNKANPDESPWHCSQELTFPEKKPVINPDNGKLGFILYREK
jgi:hypothetical protein